MRFAFLVCFAYAGLALSAEHLELYSESSFSGREELLAFNLRLRNDADSQSTGWLHPYLQAGTDLQTKGLADYDLSNASYAYFGAGLKFPFGYWALRPEVYLRGPIKLNAQAEYAHVDGRLLLAYWNLFESELGVGVLVAFAEPYTETLFSTADNFNVVHSTSVKLGFRMPVSGTTLIDILAEPYYVVDRLGRYYNNRADIKLGTRLIQRIGDLSLQLTLSAVANKYFRNAENITNPYDNRILSFRSLLVVAGYF